MKNIVSAFMVTVIVVGAVALSPRIQPVRATGFTIVIRADGSVDPPTAPLASADNITYTLTDSTNDSIYILRNNIILDGNGYAVQSFDIYPLEGVYCFGVHNVTIRNMIIKNFQFGVRLEYTNSSVVTANSIEGGVISLWSTSGNNVTGNTMEEGYYIEVFHSNSTTVTGNTNGGVWLRSSNNTRIIGNSITAGVWVDHSCNNVVSGNSIANCSDGILVESSSSNNLFSNNTVTNFDSGIRLDWCTNNTFTGNTISSSLPCIGFSLGDSHHNIISGNTFFGAGILVWQDSYENVVEGNEVNGKPLVYCEDMSDFTVGDAGQVILVNCSNMRVENLDLSNTTIGVELWKTSGSRVANNNITGNYDGVALGYSPGNAIFRNNIINNTCGVGLSTSSNSEFYHNNIINNEYQVYGFGTNTWDADYPFGGNYWSDYSGLDLFRGSDQNMTGSDGIGDTSYTIDTNNTDRYPLMGPIGSTTKTGENVTVFPANTNVCIIFENVTEEGLTTVEKPGSGPTPPPGVSILQYYVIETTADYTGQIIIKIVFNESMGMLANTTQEGDLRLLQCVMLAGDVDEDFNVDIFDIVLLAGAYGTSPPNPKYNQECDIDCDGDVDIFDLVRAAANYGEAWDPATGWSDITTRVDEENNSIFGVTQHLSIFGVTRG